MKSLLVSFLFLFLPLLLLHKAKFLLFLDAALAGASCTFLTNIFYLYPCVILIKASEYEPYSSLNINLCDG